MLYIMIKAAIEGIVGRKHVSVLYFQKFDYVMESQNWDEIKPFSHA